MLGLKAELSELMQDEEYLNLTPDFDLYNYTQLKSLGNEKQKLTQNSRILNAINVNLEKLKYLRKGYDAVKKPDLSAIAQVSLKNAEENYGGSLALDKPV